MTAFRSSRVKVIVFNLRGSWFSRTSGIFPYEFWDCEAAEVKQLLLIQIHLLEQIKKIINAEACTVAFFTQSLVPHNTLYRFKILTFIFSKLNTTNMKYVSILIYPKQMLLQYISSGQDDIQEDSLFIRMNKFSLKVIITLVHTSFFPLSSDSFHEWARKALSGLTTS